MNRRRAAIGLSLVCVLAFSAFAAPNAVAKKGTTAYTCVNVGAGKGDFKDAHCTENVGAGKGTFGHVVIKSGEKTAITYSNEKTAGETKFSTVGVFHFTLFGKKFTLECTKVHGTGTMTNEAGPPEKVKVTGIKIKMTGCSLSKESEEECKLGSEEITLEGSSTTLPESTEVEFSPESKSFASFELTGCGEEEVNGKYEIGGTFNAKPKGATMEMTAESTKELVIGEDKGASLTLLLTKRMEKVLGVEQAPISTTTVE